jgi:hypothetical protein
VTRVSFLGSLVWQYSLMLDVEHADICHCECGFLYRYLAGPSGGGVFSVAVSSPWQRL